MFPICIFILCFFCVGFYVFEFLRATSNVSAENSHGKCEYTIVIDAGHGGADGGAVASDGISEKVRSMKSMLCYTELMRQGSSVMTNYHQHRSAI